MNQFAWLSSAPVTAADLRAEMRRLWMDHVMWTRQVIVSFAAGLPDLPAATARLMRNQDDLGAAIGQFYPAAREPLTRLLKEHITGADTVLKAAKAGSSGPAVAMWRANGRQIADAISGTIKTLPAPAVQQMMAEHLDTTLAEATERLQGKWAHDAVAYDMVVEHILKMSDAISDGIARDKGLS